MWLRLLVGRHPAYLGVVVEEGLGIQAQVAALPGRILDAAVVSADPRVAAVDAATTKNVPGAPSAALPVPAEQAGEEQFAPLQDVLLDPEPAKDRREMQDFLGSVQRSLPAGAPPPGSQAQAGMLECGLR